jgi:hypothetical protein
MKKVGIFLGLVGILGIGFYAFSIGVIILKIFIGLAVLAIFSLGVLIGYILKK